MRSLADGALIQRLKNEAGRLGNFYNQKAKERAALMREAARRIEELTA